MKTTSIALILTVLAGAASISAQPPAEITESTSVELVVDRIITGDVLGQTLNDPRGMAVDFRGDVYLCDDGNNRIIKFGPDLTSLKDRGGYGSQPGQFNHPRYVAVDNNLNILVSDFGNRRIPRLDAELNYVDDIELTDEQDPLKFGQPSGLAVTQYGEIWVADADKNCLSIWNNVGQFDKLVGDFGYTGGQLAGPEKVVAYSKDSFYVCDAGNDRIVVYDSYGNYSRRMIDQSWKYPIALAFDGPDLFWLIDRETETLSLYRTDGTRLRTFGPQLIGTSERLLNPSEVAVLSGNRLLISDSGNNRLLLCRIIYSQK